MKRLVLILLVVCLFAGCNGVVMNAEYSQRLDETVVISGEASRRSQIRTDAAVAGEATPEEILESLGFCNEMLRLQAGTWIKFQQARDGVKE